MGQYFGSRVGLLVLVTLTKDWRENFSATEHFVISPIAIDFTKLHFDRVPLMSKMSLTNLSHAIHKRLQDVQGRLMYVQCRSYVYWDCLYCILVVFLSTCEKISTILIFFAYFSVPGV